MKLSNKLFFIGIVISILFLSIYYKEDATNYKIVKLPVKKLPTECAFSYKEDSIPSTITIRMPHEINDKLTFYHVAGLNILGPSNWTGKGVIGMNGTGCIELYDPKNKGKFISLFLNPSSLGSALAEAAPYFPRAAEQYNSMFNDAPEPRENNIPKLKMLETNLGIYSIENSPYRISCIVYSSLGSGEQVTSSDWAFIKSEISLPEDSDQLHDLIISDIITRVIKPGPRSQTITPILLQN